MGGYIRAIEYCLPETVLTNDDLAQQFEDWSSEKIAKKTGIHARHICADGECASDLAATAAEKLFKRTGIGKEEIDFLLFCTQSPDYRMPPNACLLQHRLGLPTTCGALDFNLGCSGFVYGLSLADSLIKAGQARNVLLVTAETYSKYIDPLDKSVRTVFGDGAAATLVCATEDETSTMGPFVYGTDGSGAENLIVPSGGARDDLPNDGSKDSGGRPRLYMNGPEVFNFTIKAVPAAVEALLTKAQKDLSAIQQVVFHQANAYMLNHLRKKIGIEKDRFYVNLTECGNTVSASIPIAVKMALAENRIKPGNTVMLVGFGVGYSWAAGLVEWR